MMPRNCPYCGGTDIVTQRPFLHLSYQETDADLAHVCVDCEASIAWPREQGGELEMEGE